MPGRAPDLRLVPIALLAAAIVALAPQSALAHCDTLDGPVVRDARAALDAGEVTPVLKWVPPDREAEIREVFEQAMTVRARGPEARALADRFFFETLVRVHRDGEGAPYTGLKPAGSPVDPAVAASDEALESGNVEPLVELITHRIDEGLRGRHARAVVARRHAGESVERGREYVAAYVDLMHYAERLLSVAGSTPDTHEAADSH
jgi:hypothetical protein